MEREQEIEKGEGDREGGEKIEKWEEVGLEGDAPLPG